MLCEIYGVLESAVEDSVHDLPGVGLAAAQTGRPRRQTRRPLVTRRKPQVVEWHTEAAEFETANRQLMAPTGKAKLKVRGEQ